MDHGFINDMAICIVVAWLLAVGAQLLKQPLIIAYLAAGVIIGGDIGLGLVTNKASIDLVSQLGLILLLYMIGLDIDLKKVVSAGRLITITGIVQMVGGCLLGLIVFRMCGFDLGFGYYDALYLGVATALSSTVIIVKILYDKRELDGLPGRITLGVLVMQDIFAIFFMALQPSLSEPALGFILGSIVKVVVLVAVAFVASRYALPSLFRAVARLPELVLVGALAWCFIVAELAAVLGLSREMGALTAGMAISTFPYTLDVVSKVTSLRDFFVTLFFVALGMHIPAPTAEIIRWALIISLFVIVSRLLTVFWPLHRMRQGHRASFLPALHLSQISEFSLVIMALGLSKYGHIRPNTEGIVAYSFVFLGIVSTYAMVNSDKILKHVSVFLSDMDIRDLDEMTAFLTKPKAETAVFVLGCSWAASSLIEEVRRTNPALLNELAVIDFNPQANEGLRSHGIHVKYGDVSQRETLMHAGVGNAQIIVCALSNTVLKGSNNMRMLNQLRDINPKAQIIVTAELLSEVPKLYAAGASYVHIPRLLEASELYWVIEAARNNMLDQKRAELDARLLDRREVIP